MQERALAPWTPVSPLHQPLTEPRLRSGAEHVSTRRCASAAGLEHDLGNLITALRLCANLIGEPGVLTSEHAHLADELSAVVHAAELLTREACGSPERRTALPITPERRMENLGQAVRSLGPLMAAVAGPDVDVQVACMPCPGELRFSEESLSRVLLNLVRNAADARPGWIRITVQRGGNRSLLSPAEMQERGKGSWRRRAALLTVEDNGTGIDPALLERIFEPGFSTRGGHSAGETHRGLGLSVVRQIVEEAGGTVTAQNRPAGGARFLIELPLTNVTPCSRPETVLPGVTDAW